ncbi:MAG: glutamate 5-kinase [Selenomonas sp.]|uniref:glutamate 5-kinase n=1 Tax=Selenomonas sp. AE3005 TaxID=1485543 RepID=UPI0004832E75|nr:glutamate 5-kinase [Selenomonas sp. AE3005]MBQ2086696.1 glutamate 5-kinase [Selenomonas sp.]
MGNARQRLQEAKRIVVKVGTSTLTHETGKLNLNRIDKLIREIADLKNQGKEMILVSSGAIAAGLGKLGLDKKPDSIPEKQAVAAIGQGVLMHIYEKLFAEYGQVMGQVLLTKENSVQHHQYIHSRNSLLAQLAMGAVPVINENDAVAVDEIKIGDNDNLSAMVATLVDADALIILSDIEGLYTANPATHPEAELISEIPEITPQVESIAGGAGSKLGTGGMMTKIQAAQIAMSAGVTMVIASGSREGVLREVLTGQNIGTVFPARESHLRVRKSWLAFGKRLAGEIVVDAGCAAAMRDKGSSLLPAGVVACAGDFAAGSTVRVLTETQQEIARGIVNFDMSTLSRVMGHKSEEITRLVGENVPEEVIHRDNMVLMV